MFKDKYVFAQLVQFLDRNKFNRLSAKYQGDRYVKSFTCWNQLLVMMFGQLSKSESLRDLIIALEVHWSKLYHLGMGKSVTRSNLAKANEGRDYRILKNTPIIWWRRHVPRVPRRCSDLPVMYMPLTPQR